MDRMTAKEFQDQPKPGATNKFGAQRVEVDGIKFDSKREATRWLHLCQLQRAGLITDLRRQVPIELQGRDGPLLTRTGRKMKYVADFSYFDVRTGVSVFEDSKGFKNQTYLLKWSVLAAQGVEVRET